jgi:AcrR family transcriptional regulator
MQARSVGRKQEILEAARVLLIEQGYDRMTFKSVAELSGAAVGSITNFFKTKEALAAAVAKEMNDKLVADAEASLERHGTDVDPAVRSLITACSRWPQKFPHCHQLARYADAEQQPAKKSSSPGLQARLESVLAAWARSLIAANRLVPLSSSELYAILIAPAACDTTRPINTAPANRRIDWVDFLASVAIHAIAVQQHGPKQRARSPAHDRPSAGPPDLFPPREDER